jgi:hypothetical protein
MWTSFGECIQESRAEVIWQFLTRCLVARSNTTVHLQVIFRYSVNIFESRSMYEHILRLNIFGKWARSFFYGSQQMNITGKNNYSPQTTRYSLLGMRQIHMRKILWWMTSCHYYASWNYSPQCERSAHGTRSAWCFQSVVPVQSSSPPP